MKDYILNKVVLKTGDSLDIVESSTLPLTEKLMYKVQDDILSLRDEDEDVYLSLNLNQVYQVEIGEKQIILFLDNDTEIQLS